MTENIGTIILVQGLRNDKDRKHLQYTNNYFNIRMRECYEVVSLILCKSTIINFGTSSEKVIVRPLK